MTFAETEAEYRRLKAQFDAGALSEADFKARLRDLMIEDDQGRWWIIGHETGQWYVSDGEQWVPGEPPRPLPEAPPPQAEAEPIMPVAQPVPEAKPSPRPAPQRARGRPWVWVTVGIAGIILLALLVQQIGQTTARPTPIPRLPEQPQALPEPTRGSQVIATPAPPEMPVRTRAPTPEPATGIVTRLEALDCDYGGKLKAIEALDDYTVRFTLCYSDAGFPAKVALPPFGIHPAEYLAATGGTGELLEKPIGTGPYRVVAWHAGNELRLEANPDYWGEKAKIPQVHLHWDDDADARLEFLVTGNVDGIDRPWPWDYAKIQNNPDLQLHLRPGLNTGYLGISNLIAPFDDVRVRQAVALAIDRAWLVEHHYLPGTTVATHFTPCEIPAGCGGEPWYDYNPDMARDMARMLLAEAGYPNGFETELFYRNSQLFYSPDPTGIVESIAGMLERNLNMRVALKAVDLDTDVFNDTAWGGKFPLYLFGWSGLYPDPLNFLNPYWSEFGTERFASGFPDIRQILREANWTASPEVRSELYARANDLIKRAVPLVPLVHVGSAAAFRADVIGAHSSPLDLERFAAMSLKQGSTLVWKQAHGPQSLYCADEPYPDTWRACAQINESLLGFQIGSVEIVPALAESYEADEDAKVWTFHLRQGVKFHDGSTLDATDVVTSWAVMWDARNPLHKGRYGTFDYFLWLFDAFLNAP